ncbi:hypothetical protein [Pseudobutyrivibrio sp.]
MGSIYDKADIYDLIEDENRYNAYKKHWEYLFEGKKIKVSKSSAREDFACSTA